MSKMLRLNKIAKQNNVGVDAIALAAVIAQPFVDITLSGAAKIEHLESNLQAIDVAEKDNVAEQLAELVVDFSETAEEYWGIRSNLAWN